MNGWHSSCCTMWGTDGKRETMSMKRYACILLWITALSSSASLAGPWDRRQPYSDEVSFTLGAFEPRGASQLWHQNERDLTVSTEDFDDAIIGARVGSAINNFVSFDVGASYYDGGTTSEDRRFTDAFGNPIEQRLRLRLFPVTATLRIMPFGQYRGGDRHHGFMRVVPYFGFGGGAMLWRYEEKGDFVDTSTTPATIFTGRFHSRGITPEYHGVLGVDIQANRQVGLFVEGKVSRAKDDLSSDFQGFDKFDLSGGSVSVGTRIRF